MTRNTTARTCTALALGAAALLLAACSGDDAGVVEDVPTAGDITGDTSVIESPTAEATEESTG